MSKALVIQRKESEALIGKLNFVSGNKWKFDLSETLTLDWLALNDRLILLQIHYLLREDQKGT